MTWIFSQVVFLIGIGLLMVLVAAVISPLESLGWWAGWSGKKSDPQELLEAKAAIPPPPPEKIKPYYLVYLSGIGQATSDSLGPDEEDFIEELGRLLPEAAIVADVFPYSVANNPLTGERLLAPVWSWVRARQVKNLNDPIALLMINIRNALQVAVSADPRYGPLYGIGVAEAIARSLVRHDYPLGTGKPVFLIGYSGGGQVSVGAAPYLAAFVGGPIYILSIGGFLSDDPSIEQTAHVFHNYGSKDPLQAMAAYIYRGRWKTSLQSAWNRSLEAGKVSFRKLGPMAHNGPGGYYDINASLPDGRSFCQATAAAVKEAVLSV